MRVMDIALPVLVFFLGLWIVGRLPSLQEDPLKIMNESTAPLLEKLVQTKYFRIIRLNVNEQCQLGVMRRICQSRSCTACRCEEGEIPEFWTHTQKVKSDYQNQDLWSDERSAIDKGWVWHVEDLANDKGEYFDIHTNIESFTNYNGSYIWKLVYEQNCFKPKEYAQNMCTEEKILYNLISGLHTSISTHLSRFYKYTITQNAWADLRDSPFHFNESEYQHRVLDHPVRIKNMMFLYRLLAKAVVKAAPQIHSNFSIQSEDFNQDMESKRLLDELMSQLQGYDLSPEEKQSLKFFTPGNPLVKQYQKYIHNISDIMNCVQCQKCRLFGKMQTYGVGTALKILLGYPTPYKRNEMVALLNVFNKLSMSVNTYYEHRKEVIPLGYEAVNRFYLDLYKVVAGFFVILYVWIKYKVSYINQQWEKEEQEDKGQEKEKEKEKKQK